MVGHAAIEAPAVAQHAEWGGVPAVSFVVLCFAVPAYELLVWAFGVSRPRARPAAAMFTLLVGCLAVGWGVYRNAQILDEEAAATRTLEVGIVQANIGGEAKRNAENGDPAARRRSQEAYIQGSKEVLAAGVDLVVWPESAVTAAVPFHQAPGMIDDFIDQYLDQYLLRTKRHRFFHNHGGEAAFLIGSYEEYRTERSSPLDMAKGRSVDRYNTAALRVPPVEGGKPQWSTVRKVYLIPFGEYLPFGLPEEQFLPQNFKMRAGADEQQPLVLDDLTLVPFLCYEGILPDYVRTLARGKRPDVLVSLTNDSWFGDSWEPHQHLNFTRFRAIEHRTPMVRSTSTGISAFISATGRVEARLGVGKRGTLIRSVPLLERGETLFVTQGHRLPLVLQIYAVLVLFLSQLRPPAPETEEQ
jgi:apolipoprotein N-acyltransferase